ncbi:hypothetical protein RFH42_14235 [Acinetobacter rudis]|uniref:Secreted protein n=1 Tax=Acinetobacter rudis TaxID=632955 RepID=A0AAW8JBA8_9GAMM|nr:hypothetical protein [Acinetobacter rudis]MDQ8936168.1 hypothetical protein [Acinetobacter rudis]MDQ8954109.1 hypothetical protein [Acinetobacter rudis]MDQ9018474.1 hypothetical protein [Acinetobacter rudis]
MKFVLSAFTILTIFSAQTLYAAKPRISKVKQVEYAEAIDAADMAVNEAPAIAAVSCDDDPNAEVCNVQPSYGGIKQRYVVKGCRVTIYNDGPVEMVNEKTGQWCDAPLPKDHVFNHPTRTYQDHNGCQISEYSIADGLGAGVADCSAVPAKK